MDLEIFHLSSAIKIRNKARDVGYVSRSPHKRQATVTVFTMLLSNV